MGSPKPPDSVGSGPGDACPGVVAGAILGTERPQRGRRFTFVEDSLYSGGTYDYITSAIRLVGGEVDVQLSSTTGLQSGDKESRVCIAIIAMAFAAATIPQDTEVRASRPAEW